MTAGMPSVGVPLLPADDVELFREALSVDDLAARWAANVARGPISAETMRGIDARAQRLGVPGDRLMEHAGAAVGAAARALLRDAQRDGDAPVVVLGGPGNNGGDGWVAGRFLARADRRSVAVLVDASPRPRTPDAARNWARLADLAGAQRVLAAAPRDLVRLRSGIERAGVVIDALLGTGVEGRLREPIAAAVELVRYARSVGVPVVAVDTPTALDPTGGTPSDPVVRADVTVTFHRPKLGHATRAGRAQAGRVLVAPIGVPADADRT